ncbi:DEAD/DEAH box helicase [Shewanella subflava]|uniref:DEAD/DEAH box helicase n=1 Tax=Shewanella subflava TaxID=2986476 RepID=A0ABT3ICQ9_9GAMM|nr:DEAD/DEAH box helicase [Shewanella subflava]MCW3173838.1 DEAD/DEAH box helicase [Shewanella subflava]
MTFLSLGLSPTIVDNLTALGYETPTAIQQKAIPEILKGKNVIAAAQTGTGKTASFVLPILQQLAKAETVRKKRMRALILAPTRELVSQVNQNIERYAKGLPLRTMAMYGGVDLKEQKAALIDGVDIVVATPGRLLDLYTQRALHFDELEVLVLDEADRMLDMGFIEDINKVLEKLPQDRQNLLFSATLSNQVRVLAKTAVRNAVEITLNKEVATKPKIEQWLTTVDKDKKSALLSYLIQQHQWPQALIFIETKAGAAKLVTQLAKRDIVAECIHGGRSQVIREQLLADFKQGNIQYLIATGVAARGIDIDDLPVVVNYDLPFPADDYIHRIGRTGRAGASGLAISLVSKDDFKNLCMIESRLGELIERRVIDGFEPKKPIPISVLNFVPKARHKVNDSKNSQPTLSLNQGKTAVRGNTNQGGTDQRTPQDNKKSVTHNKKDTNKPLPPNPWGTPKN